MLDGKEGGIAFSFHARDLHLVLGGSAGGVPDPLPRHHGTVVDQALAIRFLEPGVEARAFTSVERPIRFSEGLPDQQTTPASFADHAVQTQGQPLLGRRDAAFAQMDQIASREAAGSSPRRKPAKSPETKLGVRQELTAPVERARHAPAT